jgi:LacI family transcriptional regulator
MDEIVQLGIPYVVVNGICPEEGFSVVPDDIDGTRIALDHLRELGHSKIAYSGPLPPYLAGHSSLRDRHNTYMSQMQEYGFEPIFSSRETLDSPEDFLKETVFEKQVTAILAYGHMGALNLMQAAHTLKIPVPEELSIMCFCDEHANKVMSPGLTFINLSSAKMGKVTAELLLDQIQNPGKVKPQQVVLQENLVVRNTTASPFRRS